MSCLARNEPSNATLHVIHRGIDRRAVLLDDEDCANYLACLALSLHEQGIALHAYVLMTDHVQLLLTQPGPGRLAVAMRRIAERCVPMFNQRHGRTGTPWEDRCRVRRVDSVHDVLSVQRDIECAPLRNAAAVQATDHRWSSVHASLAQRVDPHVEAHAAYRAMGASSTERRDCWRDVLREATSEDQLASIRKPLEQERGGGFPKLQAVMAKGLDQAATIRPRGRPRNMEIAGVES